MNFKEYSANLSSVERAEARMLLENQRSSLRDKVKRALREAYGVQAAEPGMLDPAYELEPAQQFQCLEGSLPLRPPVAATLADALNGILAQALDHEFPAHPDFREDEVKITDTLVKRALEEIRNALAAPEGHAQAAAAVAGTIGTGARGRPVAAGGAHVDGPFRPLRGAASGAGDGA